MTILSFFRFEPSGEGQFHQGDQLPARIQKFPLHSASPRLRADGKVPPDGFGVWGDGCLQTDEVHPTRT